MYKLLSAALCLVVIAACGNGGKGGAGDGGGQTTPPPPPSASQQLAQDLEGLSLTDFYDVSIEALVRRSPETIIWRSLLDDVVDRYIADSAGNP